VATDEQVWAGEFGDEWTQRNDGVGVHRAPLWNHVLERITPSRVLEVGCNVGANLAHMPQGTDLYGVDINTTAIRELHHRMPAINSIVGAAHELPFRDDWFDLVFTMGLLIHIPPDKLAAVTAEIVRCSSRYELCAEYCSEHPESKPYREAATIYKRDYGGVLPRTLRPHPHGLWLFAGRRDPLVDARQGPRCIDLGDED
jgi:pseudaminic acid biosynthesis-associated methylase